MLKDRIGLYKELETKRNSKLLVYITGDRGARAELGTQIGSDIHSFFTNHLDKIGDVPKISLYLYTRGGDTLAAWSLINLIRNFCKDFEIIIPFKCHSAGTLIALGANRIVMTKQATLGPIDPSVNGPLNPQIPGGNINQRVPVSVEFVNAYLELAKNELKVSDQQSLANILISLSNQIHPLSLGQVYRSKSQIQMIAKRLLNFQEIEAAKRDEIIKFLCSESGSHDYTIHRNEAKELGLNIEKPNEELYKIIQSIYLDIENELQLLKPVDLKVILAGKQSENYSFRRALIESTLGGCDVFLSQGTLTRQQLQQPGVQPLQVIPQTGIQDNRIFEGWKHEEL